MTDPDTKPQPLARVRVIEVAGFVFAPIATAIMADLGADVVKVEPIGGDQLRQGQTGSVDEERVWNGVAVLVELSNRGKRSVALDLATTQGHDVLCRLIEGADVFVTSYLERVRQRLRIDVEHVRAINPGIVYARASGWGPSGPMRNAPAFDLVSAWSGSGVASLMSDAGGEPPSMPIGIFDVQAGALLAGAISTALYQRASTGQGCVVDTALLNVGMWPIQAEIAARRLGIDSGTTVRADPSNALVNWYQTSDRRWLFLALVRSDAEWIDLCRAIGRQDLTTDPRFATPAERRDHAKQLADELERALAQRTLDDWQERFADFGGCWGPMLTEDESPDHVQVTENGFIIQQPASDGTVLDLVAPPMHFDGSPTQTSGPAPALGQHTVEVLAEIGIAGTELQRLAKLGAIRCG